MTGNVTRLTTQIDIAVPGSGRLSRAQFHATYADKTYAVRVTRVQFHAMYGDRTYPVRMTQLHVQVLSPLPTIQPTVLTRASIGNLSINNIADHQTVEPSNLEPNPYKPTLPSDVTDGLSPAAESHASSQQEMIRKQHNNTQAGDTTFPWDLIQQSTSNAQFNLGSQGRFFTPNWGIVQAVYVQFSRLNREYDIGEMPYGRLKSSQSVDWKVTNDFSLSGEELAVGIGFMLKMPAEGDYGWLVTRGASISSLLSTLYENLSPGDVFTWGTTGKVSHNGTGIVIARVWGTPSSALLAPGDILVDVGGLSPKSIQNLISTDLTSLQTAVSALQSAVLDIQQAPSTDYSESISKLQQAIQLVANSLTRESQARVDRDNQLADLIGQGQVTIQQFNDYKSNLNGQITTLTQQLTDGLKAANTAIAKVKAITDQLNPGQINGDIANLKALLSQLLGTDQIPSRFPVVTGDVPPVFVYLNDGSLVYVEN